MKQIRWFDRGFSFDQEQNIFPAILERLEGTPIRLSHKMHRIPAEWYTRSHQGSWTMNEQVGHLIDLEPLWQGRVEDILGGVETMRSADLENRKTHEAGHNQRRMESLLEEFAEVRQQTLDMIQGFSEEQVFASALHPRLKQPMRMMDLFLFVAEHDDHHLARITELSNVYG